MKVLKPSMRQILQTKSKKLCFLRKGYFFFPLVDKSICVNDHSSSQVVLVVNNLPSNTGETQV